MFEGNKEGKLKFPTEYYHLASGKVLKLEKTRFLLLFISGTVVYFPHKF